MERTGGPYVADPGDDFGQYSSRQPEDQILNSNAPPSGQPGLWCHWVANETGDAIFWDGGEKFYNAAEWMAYIINHFLRPGATSSKYPASSIAQDSRFEHFTFDHSVNGVIHAEGEESGDIWALEVTDNEVTTRHARLQYGEAREIR